MTIASPQQRRRRLASLLLIAVGLTPVLPLQARDLPPIRESRPLGEAPVPPSTADGVNKPRLSLEERVARLESLLEGQALVEMLMKVEQLQTDVQELRGQNEVYAHEIEGMKKRQRDLYMDIDRRLNQVMQSVPGDGQSAGGSAMNGRSQSQGGGPTGGQMAGAASAAATAAGQATAAGGQMAGQAAGAMAATGAAAQQQQSDVDPQAEQAAYRKAFEVLKDGRYEDSIASFNSFLQAYPNGQYADNANYWIGEANYVLRRFPAAINSFQQVIQHFPGSPKLADARLKIGYSYYELKQWDKARNELEAIMKNFPSTTAAQLASNRLRQMKVEGH